MQHCSFLITEPLKLLVISCNVDLTHSRQNQLLNLIYLLLL